MARSGRSLQRVREALARLGLEVEIETFPATTRTAEDAARAVGCEVAQIAKSLVFRTTPGGEPLIVVTSGAHRVDPLKVAEQIGEAIEMADPAFVRERTGYAVGGVAPVGHDGTVRILLDRHLLGFERIWAAAGRPDSVFAVSPRKLLEVTGAEPVEVQ